VTTALLTDRFEEMRAWRRARRPRIPDNRTTVEAAGNGSLTPEEALAASYSQIRESVESDVLERAKAMPPDRFERLVLDLLLRLGYGGPLGWSVHLGKSGDGGIDGVIQQDKLGLDQIYVQAKRWQGSVGSSIVREFAGSLSTHRARKGVIITTSTFTTDAKRDADRMGDRIVLIDGAELAALMYEVGLGVTVAATYELKRPDSDYFDPA
jgi:restriction system protein